MVRTRRVVDDGEGYPARFVTVKTADVPMSASAPQKTTNNALPAWLAAPIR
jgi:hypothetical protein